MTAMDQPCWHCATPVRGKAFMAHTPQGEHPACCAGCAAAIESIHSLGLGDYYRFRTTPGGIPEQQVDGRLDLALFELPELVAPFVRSVAGQDTLTLRVDGLHCAACVWLIQKAISSLEGVQQVTLNLATGRLQVSYMSGTRSPADIARRLLRLGYRPCLPTRDARLQQAQLEYRHLLRRLLVAALCSMQAMMYATALYLGTFDEYDAFYEHLLRLVTFVVATPAVFYSGWPFFAGAWYALRARTLTMDVPVAMALGLAWSGSVVALLRGTGHVYFESLAMFVFFLLISRWLLQRQHLRSAEAHSRLAETLPAMARRQQADGTWQPVAAVRITTGDRLMVQQGEVVPVDGTMCAGAALLDEAVLSGESLPCSRNAGDSLSAGARVLEGQLEMTAQGQVAESRVARLGQLLDESADHQAALHLYGRELVPWFILAVIGLAAATLWLHRDAGLSSGIEYALAVLVVTCPCALALAIPLAISAAQTNALQAGVLVSQPLQLLQLNTVDTIMLDKTGTLTTGDFQLIHTQQLDYQHPESRLLAIAAALECGAVHPLARALGSLAPPAPIEAFNQTRKGVSGCYAGSRWHICAAPGLAPAEAPPDATVVALFENSVPAMVFCLADVLREDAAPCCDTLRDRGFELVLASGDNPAAVGALATRLGIRQWQAGLAPEDKSEWLHGLKAQGRRILMMGDGVNDAPALLAADAAVATADSAALARDAAGIYLLKPRLRLLPWLFRLSARTHKTMRWNIIWAIGYNLVAVPFAMAGMVPPWLAAIGMSMSSLIVTTNSARLARWKS